MARLALLDVAAERGHDEAGRESASTTNRTSRTPGSRRITHHESRDGRSRAVTEGSATCARFPMKRWKQFTTSKACSTLPSPSRHRDVAAGASSAYARRPAQADYAACSCTIFGSTSMKPRPDFVLNLCLRGAKVSDRGDSVALLARERGVTAARFRRARARPAELRRRLRRELHEPASCRCPAVATCRRYGVLPGARARKSPSICPPRTVTGTDAPRFRRIDPKRKNGHERAR